MSRLIDLPAPIATATTLGWSANDPLHTTCPAPAASPPAHVQKPAKLRLKEPVMLPRLVEQLPFPDTELSPPLMLVNAGAKFAVNVLVGPVPKVQLPPAG